MIQYSIITDTLARLSVFLLSDPSPSFTSLLQPLLTQKTIPNTLVVILLDWAKPWLWLRQLQAWIRLLRALFSSLGVDCKEKMEETMNFWQDKGRSSRNIDGLSTSNLSENDFSLPLGSGEWDEALGIPLCVVCQNVRINFEIYQVSLTFSLVGPNRISRKRTKLEGRRI